MLRSKKRYEKQQRDELRKQTKLIAGQDAYRVEHPNITAIGDGVNSVRSLIRFIKNRAG